MSNSVGEANQFRYFKCQGTEGCVDENDYVTWAGNGFHKSAAKSPSLRMAIHRAKAKGSELSSDDEILTVLVDIVSAWEQGQELDPIMMSHAKQLIDEGSKR